MTRQEYLLACLAEECAEVAQRVSKAMRFGMDEVQPGQELTNGARIVYELGDLTAVVEMLQEEGIITEFISEDAIEAKKAKIEKYIAYSKECGVLE